MNGHPPTVAVIGAGPAGLMAADVLASAGVNVTVFESKPSPARKFLMAGRGGLNLTHSEPLDAFVKRYGAAADVIGPLVRTFPPLALIAWANALGQETFVGTSGRVFPRALKASPLLRAWMRRLADLGVRFRFRHRWTGWQDQGADDQHEGSSQHLTFVDDTGAHIGLSADAVILALGGASWPRLGSDGSWVAILKARGVKIAPLGPFNAGVLVPWSETIKTRFAGAPLKRITVRVRDAVAAGEAVITRTGLEGGAIYQLNTPLKAAFETPDPVVISLDLRPALGVEDLAKSLSAPRARQSAATFLRKAARLSKAAIAVLREPSRGDLPQTPEELARLIKAVPIRVTGLSGVDRAISTTGGIMETQIDGNAMISTLPGVFTAGEMRDWDAPTGGYLLQATFATGLQAGRGALSWLTARQHPKEKGMK